MVPCRRAPGAVADPALWLAAVTIPLASQAEAPSSIDRARFVDAPIGEAVGDAFDDLALWRDKAGLARSTGVVFAGAMCTAANDLWTSTGCSPGSGDDACLTAGGLSRCTTF